MTRTHGHGPQFQLWHFRDDKCPSGVVEFSLLKLKFVGTYFYRAQITAIFFFLFLYILCAQVEYNDKYNVRYREHTEQTTHVKIRKNYHT